MKTLEPRPNRNTSSSLEKESKVPSDHTLSEGVGQIQLLLRQMPGDHLLGIDERLLLLLPLCEEDQQDFIELDEGITTLLDEIARLEELHCYDCPRNQEMISSESQIARSKLRLFALEYQKIHWVEEIEEERKKERADEPEPGISASNDGIQVEQCVDDRAVVGFEPSFGDKDVGRSLPEIVRNGHPEGELEVDRERAEEALAVRRPVLEYILSANEVDDELKGYLIKAPEAMLDRWRTAAQHRKVSASQMIREAVNRDIDAWENSVKSFDPDCKGAVHHVAGELCRRCGGSK